MDPTAREKTLAALAFVEPARLAKPLARRRRKTLEERLGHAFKRGHRINLHRPCVRFRLDGVALRGQFCAVPADNSTLPSGARLLAYTISQAKRGAQWQCKLTSNRSTDVIATLIHT